GPVPGPPDVAEVAPLPLLPEPDSSSPHPEMPAVIATPIAASIASARDPRPCGPVTSLFMRTSIAQGKHRVEGRTLSHIDTCCELLGVRCADVLRANHGDSSGCGGARFEVSTEQVVASPPHSQAFAP